MVGIGAVANAQVPQAQELFTSLPGRFSSIVEKFSAEPMLSELPNSFNTLPGPLRVEKNSATAESRPTKTPKLSDQGVFSRTNQERQSLKLPTLKWNNTLAKAASLKLDDMFAAQYFDHVSPQGLGPGDVAKKAGYEFVLVGENLALGDFNDDADLVEGWMNSPGHRANILHEGFTELGIAVARGEFEGKTVWLAVQSFGKPLTDCPEIDQALKNKIEQNQTVIYQLETDAKNRKQALESGQYAKPQPYNSKVEEYNVVVGKLNTLIEETKNLVNEYNAQVNQFNSCAGSHT